MNSTIKERPILFSGPMVRAILEGRKTVTRRVMKPQPVLNGGFWELGGAGWSDRIPSITPVAGHSLAARSPYGQPGDRLWVRETWQLHEKFTDNCVVVYKANERNSWTEFHERFPVSLAHGVSAKPFQTHGFRPSIHMPRWASRILLEVTAVRVERLGGISKEQALAEGVEAHPSGFFGNGCITAGGAFLELWESINGAGSWEANPWVWVVEFKRVMP